MNKMKFSFPVLGLNKRLPHGAQPENTTPAARNVRPDDSFERRERGGSRPALKKAHPEQVSGGSSPGSLLSTLRYITPPGSTVIEKVVASANGEVWWGDTPLEKITNAPANILTDNHTIMAAEQDEKLYIADYDVPLVIGSDLSISTKAAAGQSVVSTDSTFVTDSVSADIHDLAVESAGEVTNEVQTVTVTGNPTSGSYKLSFMGAVTNSLDEAIPAATLQRELEALKTIQTGNVTCAGGDHPGTPITVTFVNKFKGWDAPMILLDTNALSGGSSPTVTITETTKGASGLAETSVYKITNRQNETTLDLQHSPDVTEGADNLKFRIQRAPKVLDPEGKVTGEVQTVQITGTPDGGTFRLTFRGQQTAARAWNIAPSALETALEALSTIGADNVVCGGTADALPDTAMTVTFQEDLVGIDVPMMTLSNNSLTGGSTPSVTITETTKGGLFPDVYKWVASPGKGFVPLGSRFVAAWRSRMVMVDEGSPHILRMSRMFDPHDWLTSDDISDATRPFMFSVGTAGVMGEPIISVIPWSDNCLIVFTESSTWVLRGDPAEGGELLRLDADIGIVGPMAWCMIEKHHAIFLSHDGVYAMLGKCGTPPISLSREKLPADLLNETDEIILENDIHGRGFYIIRSAASGAKTHYFADFKTTPKGDKFDLALFEETFGDLDHEPVSVHQRRGYTSSTSWTLFGCRDGYVRSHDPDTAQDDTTEEVQSYVDLFSPISEEGTEATLLNLKAALAEGSGDVDYEIYVGNTAERANNKTEPDFKGTWYGHDDEGMQHTVYPMVTGTWAKIRLKNGESNRRWALESLIGAIRTVSRVRRR